MEIEHKANGITFFVAPCSEQRAINKWKGQIMENANETITDAHDFTDCGMRDSQNPMTVKELARNFKKATTGNGAFAGLGVRNSFFLYNYLCGGGYEDKFTEVKAILKKQHALTW